MNLVIIDVATLCKLGSFATAAWAPPLSLKPGLSKQVVQSKTKPEYVEAQNLMANSQDLRNASP